MDFVEKMITYLRAFDLIVKYQIMGHINSVLIPPVLKNICTKRVHSSIYSVWSLGGPKGRAHSRKNPRFS